MSAIPFLVLLVIVLAAVAWGSRPVRQSLDNVVLKIDPSDGGRRVWVVWWSGGRRQMKRSSYARLMERRSHGSR